MNKSAKNRIKPAKAASELPYTEAQRSSGDWNPLWDTLCSWDPEFMERYLAFRSVPHRNGPIPPKYKELIMIAINVATTHMYGPGVRRHIQNALQKGATREEILEAIQLTTVLGIHACNIGIPILSEVLESRKTKLQRQATTASQRKPRAKPVTSQT